MRTKLIPLSQFEEDVRGILAECSQSGQSFVVELPDHSLVAIQSLEPTEDDSLVSELLESNPAFRALMAKSKASSRKPFGSE